MNLETPGSYLMLESKIASIFIPAFVVTYACLIWGGFFLFKSEKLSMKMVGFAILWVVGFLIDCFFIFSQPSGSIFMTIAIALNLSAAALFFWTANTAKKRGLAAIFSATEPSFLILSGPYRFIRHPYYASYILFWASAVLASCNYIVLLPFIILSFIYLLQIRAEETKLSSSLFDKEYEEYIASTGALLPFSQSIKRIITRIVHTLK